MIVSLNRLVLHNRLEPLGYRRLQRIWIAIVLPCLTVERMERAQPLELRFARGYYPSGERVWFLTVRLPDGQVCRIAHSSLSGVVHAYAEWTNRSVGERCLGSPPQELPAEIITWLARARAARARSRLIRAEAEAHRRVALVSRAATELQRSCA